MLIQNSKKYHYLNDTWGFNTFRYFLFYEETICDKK